MAASADHLSVPAAGGGADLPPLTLSRTNPTAPCIHVCAFSGDSDMLVAGWLRVAGDAVTSKTAVTAWADFREQLSVDPALNIRRGDTLRARKLAAGQGRPRPSSTRRGPSKAEQWGYRHVLRRGLTAIASLPGTTVGTARTGPATPTATEAVLKRLAKDAGPSVSGAAVIRTTAATASWYDLATASPLAVDRHSDTAAHISAGTDSLLEAAEFVAYCAYQFLARRYNRRFLWEWLPELLPDATKPINL
ncbi:hypothetical protein [Streptomyces tendae]|uniref:hypothetical protein n=1 Tax=Streptomyces tendae TaxID=1932 RepID=UPI00365B598D